MQSQLQPCVKNCSSPAYGLSASRTRAYVHVLRSGVMTGLLRNRCRIVVTMQVRSSSRTRVIQEPTARVEPRVIDSECLSQVGPAPLLGAQGGHRRSGERS